MRDTFKIDNQNYQFLADLEYYDGTLIGLVRDLETRQLQILHWVGVSDNFHKWLLFPVAPRGLKLFLEGKISNADLFWLAEPDLVTLVELNGDFETGVAEKVPVSTLPEKLVPTDKSGFNPNLCPDLPKIHEILKETPTHSLALA